MPTRASNRASGSPISDALASRASTSRTISSIAASTARRRPTGSASVRGTRGSSQAATPATRRTVAGLGRPACFVQPRSAAMSAMIAADPGSITGRTRGSSRAPIGCRSSRSSRSHSRSPAGRRYPAAPKSTRGPASWLTPDSRVVIASRPSGVIGCSIPCTAPNENQIASSGPSGIGNSDVIGRACTRLISPPASVHSMSCGPPRASATWRPSAASSRAWASVRVDASPGSRSDVETPPAESGVVATAFAPRARVTAPAASTTRWSGSTWPDTSASPKPNVASITVSPRAPVSGFTVNRTPLTSAGTSRCTTTARATSSCGMPLRMR